MLGVCEKSVRRLIDRGLLKTSRALRHHRVTKQEIERFLKDTPPDCRSGSEHRAVRRRS